MVLDLLLTGVVAAGKTLTPCPFQHQIDCAGVLACNQHLNTTISKQTSPTACRVRTSLVETWNEPGLTDKLLPVQHVSRLAGGARV
jgi:hypothetical protein